MLNTHTHTNTNTNTNTRHASYAVEKWHAASGMQLMVVADHHHISISKIADGPKRNYITPRMQDITSMCYMYNTYYDKNSQSNPS